MTSDLARAIAFAFRRKGVDAMPGGDLRLLLAYDLRWFAPEDAKRCVHRAVEAGLLREENGALRPSFDVHAIDIPLNFRPGPDAFEGNVAPPPPAAASPAAPAPPPQAGPAAPAAPAAPPAAPAAIERAAEDERRRRGLMVSLDVARLIVRRRAGEDVAAEAAALEARRLTRA
ncbi:MAG TPA: DUF2240 family protein [Candidatus Thermoplasmatota archaeon]|nr:DUF2240 family protein [Candidatus Thermoplasmatota archaeon]